MATSSGDVSAFKSSKGAALINGIHTDIYCSDFTDRVFVCITQYEKLGTMVSVNKDSALDDLSGIETYSTKTLLGEDDPTTTVIARNLATHMDVSKPVLFALALRDKSPSILRPITELLLCHKCW